MVNMKKMLNFLYILCLSVSVSGNHIDSYAIKSTSETSINSELDVDKNKEVRDEIKNSSMNNELRAEDFMKKDEITEKEGGETWTDDLLTPEDFLDKRDIGIDEFEHKILTKMLEVVSLLQTFAKPFCIILFIICALGTLISIVFSTNKQKMFILGLMLSVITYVGITFAPQLVLFFADWLSF